MAALLAVAEAFYLARMILSGIEEPPPFDELPGGVRHAYVMVAQETLARAPGLPITTPAASRDASPASEGMAAPGRYFQIAAELARADGARVLGFRPPSREP